MSSRIHSPSFVGDPGLSFYSVENDGDIDALFNYTPRLRDGLLTPTSAVETDIAEWDIDNAERPSASVEHATAFAFDSRIFMGMALRQPFNIVVLDGEGRVVHHVHPGEFFLMRGLRCRRPSRTSIMHPERRTLYIEEAPHREREDHQSRILHTLPSLVYDKLKSAVCHFPRPWQFARSIQSFQEFRFRIVTAIHCIYMLILLFIPRNYAARAGSLAPSSDRGISGSEVQGFSGSSSGNHRSGHIGIEMEDISRELPSESGRSDHQHLVPDSDPAQNKWNWFLSKLYSEWKLVQFGSGLLIPAVLTIFQIPGAGDDSATRLFGILSLVCSVTGLTYSCIFLSRIHQMRQTTAYSDWIQGSCMGSTVPRWWNCFIFLSMPVVWISWSSIFFITTLLCIIWQKSQEPSPDPNNPAPFMNSTASTFTTCILAIAIFYFYLIGRTLSKYTTE
ncbi:hypothetical protein BDZ94DRAFT_813588 [Collybia nuda]|uniref:Uncharacterized protein n=1 Tax=Collybia nuda TaxID=64659 RepID=A0A9P5Y528_9AGAR|nr:hypothetical protein BDZ94DRAFT_813588 [Collybia nuda]